MIISFVHKELKKFFNHGNDAKLPKDHIKKLRLLLANLNAATTIDNMNSPGLALHKLHGDKEGFWSVKVNGNWRLIFRFDNGDAYDVDYTDYH